MSMASRHGIGQASGCILSVLLVAAVIAPAQAQTLDAQQLQIRDVELESGHVLAGRAVSRAGQPLAGRTVILRDTSRDLARAETDGAGTFRFANVRSGIYQVLTADDIAICRAWATGTAPPAAQRQVQLFSGSVVRAQCGCRGWRRCASCCGTEMATGYSYGGGGGTAMAPIPEPPSMSIDELRELAPDLPDEQFAALTRASVVIVNPDHYSVIIEYNAADGTATVVGKAVDNVALQIQSVARGGGIPVVSEPALARALHAQVGIGQAIPEPLLGRVANVMADLAQAPAVVQPGIEPGGFDGGGFEGGGFEGPLVTSPRFLVAAGLISAGIAIPVAIAADDDDHDSGS